MSELVIMPGERMPPLYFAGREAELRRFHGDLRALCSTGASNGLLLTIGVPGSGKTRLAEEFLKSVDGTTVGGRVVATLAMSPKGMESSIDLFLEMADALDERKLADQVAQHDDKFLGVASPALGISRDIKRHTPGFPRLLTESKRRGMWDGKVLVLVVDELQSVSDAGMEALCELHNDTHTCPVLLMGFGLQHTATRLANPSHGRGISRIAEPTILHPLAHPDTVDIFKQTLDRLGHGDVPAPSVEALAHASHGFPQHVNGYLEGAHKALLQHGHLTDDSIGEALAHGHRRRVSYYEARLAHGNSHAPMRTVVGAMERAGATAMRYRDAKRILAQAGFEDDALDAAIAHGALMLAGEDVSFGIPSFHAYMKQLLSEERMRQNAGC